MPRSCLVLLAVVACAAAFQAPVRAAVARVPAVSAMKSDAPSIDKTSLMQAAALAPVLAAAPAGAFSADYLPAILVPVMTLFLPAMGMALGFILVTKEEI